MILKGGMIAAAPMGDANASIPTPQPVHFRPMFEFVLGRAMHCTHDVPVWLGYSIWFARATGVKQPDWGSENCCCPVKKAHMIHNDWQPLIEVDSQTYQVRANGELLTCEPAAVLPMAQRYFYSRRIWEHKMIRLTQRLTTEEAAGKVVFSTLTLPIDLRIKVA